MNLTINDFRSVLGNVNDGNVVFKEDNSGIEKANHGNMITRFFRNYRQVASDPVENQLIRRGLMEAICGSVEGKALDERQMDVIRNLVLGGGDDISTDALDRKQLKIVLDTVELMVRGEEVPRDGVPAEMMKNVPDATKNKLIDAQIGELDKVGYGGPVDQNIVATVREKTQDVSTLMAEKCLKKIFEKGYEGHSQQEMMRFVRNSAANIQSKIFDRILWEAIDIRENDPGAPGTRVYSRFTKDIFLEVIHDMMATYAEGREPLPKTDMMLRRLDEEVPVVDGSVPLLEGQMAELGTEYLEGKVELLRRQLGEANDKFQHLVECLTSSKHDFDARQVNNFMYALQSRFAREMAVVSGYKATVYKTYIQTFQGTAGTNEDRRDAAVEAVEQVVGRLEQQLKENSVMRLIDRFSERLLKSFSEKPAISGRIFQMAAGKIAQIPVGAVKQFDVDAALEILGRVADELENMQSLGLVARAMADQASIGAEGYDDFVKEVVEALNGADGELGMAADDVRSMMVEAKIADPNADLAAVARGFVGSDSRFVELVNAKLSEKLDLVAIREAAIAARNAQFVKIAALKTAYNPDKLLADTFIVSNKAKADALDKDSKRVQDYRNLLKKCEDDISKAEDDLKQDAVADRSALEGRLNKLRETRKSLERSVRGAERDYAKTVAEYEKYNDDYYAVVNDPVFRGKLVIVCECGLLEQNPELKGRFYNVWESSYKITPENLEDARREFDRVLDGIPLSQLEALTAYIADGASSDDQYGQASKAGSRPFRDMYLDGRFDFTGVSPQAKSYLMTGYDVSRMTENRGTGIPAKSHIPEKVFAAYYRELRQAVVDSVARFNEGREEEDKVNLNAALSASGLLAEAPLPYDNPGFKFNMGDDINELLGGLALKPFKYIWGFGSHDPKVVRGVMKRVGLELADLNEPEGWLKAQRLSVIIEAHGGHAEGAVEWAERVIGKSFGEMRFSDLMQIAQSTLNDAPIADPMDALTGDPATIAKYLSGKTTLADANLRHDDIPVLLDGLRSLASGAKESVSVKLFGTEVGIALLPDGSLTAKVKISDQAAMPVSVAHSAFELIAQIENLVVDHAASFTKDQLLAVLPGLPKKGAVIARPRELYSKALASLLNLPSVSFAHLSTEALHALVNEVVSASGKDLPAIAGRFAAAPTDYNSAEMVELQERYLAADPATRALVKVPPTAKTRTIEQRRLTAPTDQEVHDFISDLIMNKDSWAYDEGMRTPGRRIFELVRSYGPEIEHLKNNPGLCDTLPEFIREDIGGLLVKLQEIAALDSDKAKLARCKTLETEIDRLVTTAILKMQDEASALFGVSAGDRRETWQKSLSELDGADGLSGATSQGRFNKKVLDNYFKRCGKTEQRSMLANIIRNTICRQDEDPPTRGKLVGEMLKGAGPLLQKMLQGLSASTFGPETQLALKDMKSNLLPIPDSVIKAQLLELIRSSNGEILSIDYKKSLGQATVGQALLCHIRTKEHPVVGEDVVIKILRPNVQTAVQREYEVMMAIARDLDREEGTGTSQQDTFRGRYATVLKEFDFTLESSNIDLCKGVYGEPTAFFGKGSQTEKYLTVHSMDRSHAVMPMTCAIVLQKVDGKPVDRMLEDTRKEVDEIVKDLKVTTQAGPNAPKVTVYRAKTPQAAIDAKVGLWNTRQRLLEQHREISKFVDIWLEKALFGDGVFHNDLHPGNMLINDLDVSAIDFGNVGRLSKDQQNQLVFMFTGAMSGSVDDFLAGVEAMLGSPIPNVKTAADPSKGVAEQPGLRDRLKSVVTEIFDKGTSDDVLPRLLGALSSLKDFAIPIPEVVHNFAESMARLQTVVDGVTNQIAEIESISDEIVLEDGELADFKLDDKWNVYRFKGDGANGAEPPKSELFEVLDGLRELLKTIGAADRKFNGEAVQTAYNALAGKMKNKDFRADFVKQIESFFALDDGGIGLLKDVVSLVSGIPDAVVKSSGNRFSRARLSPCGRECSRMIGLYEQAFRNKDDDELENVRHDLVQQLCDLFVSAAHGLYNPNLGIGGTGGPVIYGPAAADDFIHCVGSSLMKRSDMLVKSLALAQGIPGDVFDRAMAADGIGGFLMSGALSHLSQFKVLRGIQKKLKASSDSKDGFESGVKLVSSTPVAPGAHQTFGNVLPSAVRRKIDQCAHEFRCPHAWRGYPDVRAAMTDLAGKADEVKQVFQANFEALKKTLVNDTPTDVQIRYFAGVLAAANVDAEYLFALGGYSADQIRDLAGGSRELELLMTAYREFAPKVFAAVQPTSAKNLSDNVESNVESAIEAYNDMNFFAKALGGRELREDLRGYLPKLGQKSVNLEVILQMEDLDPATRDSLTSLKAVVDGWVRTLEVDPLAWKPPAAS